MGTRISTVYSDHGQFEGELKWLTEKHSELGERQTHVEIIDPVSLNSIAIIRIDFVTGIFPKDEG